MNAAGLILFTDGPLQGEIVDGKGIWIQAYSLDSLESLMEDPDDGVDGDEDGLYYLFVEWCDRHSLPQSDSTLKDWIASWKRREMP